MWLRRHAQALKAFARVSDTVSVLAPAPAWGCVELFAALPLTMVDVVVTDRGRSEDGGRTVPTGRDLQDFVA